MRTITAVLALFARISQLKVKKDKEENQGRIQNAGRTYMQPKPRIAASAALVLKFICNVHTSAIGSRARMKSQITAVTLYRYATPSR